MSTAPSISPWLTTVPIDTVVGVSQAGWGGARMCCVCYSLSEKAVGSLLCILPCNLFYICLVEPCRPKLSSAAASWMCDILSIGTCHRYWPRKREKPTWGTCEAFPPTEQSSGLSQRNSGRRWRLRRSPRGQMGQGLREADKQRDRNKTAEEPNKISNVLSLIMLHEEFVWATRGYVQHSLQIVAQSHSF